MKKLIPIYLGIILLVILGFSCVPTRVTTLPVNDIPALMQIMYFTTGDSMAIQHSEGLRWVTDSVFHGNQGTVFITKRHIQYRFKVYQDQQINYSKVFYISQK